jgi:hypothetical protein
VSEENVEIVRRWVEEELNTAPAELNTAPAKVKAYVARFYDPDADYYPVRKFPEARPCHGYDEIVQFLVGYLAAYSRFEYALRHLIQVGDDRVLVCGSVHAEGLESGLALDGDLYYCSWLRHGRFFRREDHLTLRGALHALGLVGETLEAAGLKATSLEE